MSEVRSSERSTPQEATGQVHSLYVKNGVAAHDPADQRRYLLHECCPARAECWGNRIADAGLATWNEICLPYVGARYGIDDGRVAVLGLNWRGWGGLRLAQEILPQVADVLRSGKKKATGTLYWHRLAAYASLLVWSGWQVVNETVLFDGIDILSHPERLACAVESIAYLEAVKCSPPWRNSTPTREMRRECPGRFLRHELEALAPSAILRLGRGTPIGLGATNTPMRDLDGSTPKCTRVATPWGQTLVVTVPHPTSYGGSRRSVVGQLGGLLRKFDGGNVVSTP